MARPLLLKGCIITYIHGQPWMVEVVALENDSIGYVQASSLNVTARGVS
jgi:hypothetical protein